MKWNYIRQNNFNVNLYNETKKFLNIELQNSTLEEACYKNKEINNILNSILILNPNLHRYLFNNKNKLDEKSQAIVWKYYLRGLFKATPLAGMSTAIIPEYTNSRYIIDIDSLWINKFITKYKDIRNISKKEKIIVFVNGSVIEKEKFYRVFNKDNNEITINKKSNLEKILKVLKNGITLEEFFIILKNNNKDYKDDDIFKLISLLERNALINFDIKKNFYNSNNIDIMKNFIDVFNIPEDIRKKIEEIFNLFNKLNKNNNMHLYLFKIIDIMNSICNCDRFISVVERTEGNFHIKENLYNDFESLIKDFSKLLFYAPDNIKKKSIKNYILNNYGKNSLVSLHEIYNYSKNIDNSENFKEKFYTILDNVLYNILCFSYNAKKCDLNLENYIKLCIEELDKCIKKRKGFISINIDMIFNENIDFDNNDILSLSEDIGSMQSGKLIGRFIINDKQKFVNEKTKIYLKNNILPVSITSYIKDSVAYNVLDKANYKIKELCINSTKRNKNNSCLNLSDIYFYVDEYEELCLYSKLDNKRIIFVNYNAINPELCGNICKFLLDVTEEPNIIKILFFLREKYYEKNISKQIFFKNILLFEPSYIFKQISEKSFKINSLINFIRQKFPENNDIYDFYFSDEKITLDLSIDIHKKILYREILKNKEVKIKSISRLLTNNIKNSIDYYNKDYVLNFSKVIQSNNTSKKPFFSDEIIKIFEGQMVSLKIYVDYIYEISILKYINIFLEKRREYLKTNKIKFNFVRYKDEFSHIRFRIYFENNIDYYFLDEFIKNLNSNDIINNIIVGEYIKENVRYGKNSYNLYQKLIQIETNLVLLLFSKIKDFETIKKYAILLGIDIIKIFNSESELRKIFISGNKYYSFKKKLQKEKNYLNEELYELKNKLTIDKELSVHYDTWKKHLINYFNSVSNEKDTIEIMYDLLHLMSNKFIGINRETENKILESIKVISLYRISKGEW